MSETLFPMPEADPELIILPGDRHSVRLTKARNLSLANGRHPFGFPLREPAGETCGSCRHCVCRSRGSRYYKCELMRSRWTCGPGTDLRLKWPACTKWEPLRNPTEPANVATPSQPEPLRNEGVRP